MAATALLLGPFEEWVASDAQLIKQPRRTATNIMCDLRFEDDEDIKIIKRYCRVRFELNFFLSHFARSNNFHLTRVSREKRGNERARSEGWADD